MNRRRRDILIECVLDLGITVVYATAVGLVIVLIVASDDASPSLLTLLLYAGLLPGAVVVLIGFDLVLRLLEVRRSIGGHPPIGRQRSSW